VATVNEARRNDRAGVPAGVPGPSTSVLLALVWLLGASAVLLLFLGSRLTFLLDDWSILIYRPGFDLGVVLDPHNEHIVAIPVLVYKALLEVFGMGSALPFRVASTGVFLLSAILLFALLRRRVGDWPALAGTAVVLFLGAAWEDLLWPFQIGYFGSMAAGLGALLALERDGRNRDVLAAGLLCLSVLFSSLGLPFIAGAGVGVLTRPDRWRRLAVVAVPAAVWLLWWLGWGHTGETHASWANFAQIPAFTLNGIAAALTALFGLSLAGGDGGMAWGRPLAVAAIGLMLWRLGRLGRAPSWLWVLLAIAGSFWFLAGLNQIPGRSPEASRYQYIGVIFILLIAAELLRGIRISRGAVLVVLAIAAGSVAGNVYYLHQAYLSYRVTSQLEKADLAALDLARGTVEPGFLLEEDIADTGYVHIDAGSYFAARDEFGSPAYSPEELAEAPGNTRYAADKVLFAALRLQLAPVEAGQLRTANSRPAQVGADGTVAVPAQGCVEVASEGEATPLIALPRGGGAVLAEDAPVSGIKMARFSEGEMPIDFQQGLEPGEATELRIPTDRSDVPWKIQLQTGGSATVCGLTS
jgi:hypothetical protein